MCQSCEAVTINGVLCHEHGCPDAWTDEIIECKWCGQRFKPEQKGQMFCNDWCYKDYYNLPYDEQTENEDNLT